MPQKTGTLRLKVGTFRKRGDLGDGDFHMAGIQSLRPDVQTPLGPHVLKGYIPPVESIT